MLFALFLQNITLASQGYGTVLIVALVLTLIADVCFVRVFIHGRIVARCASVVLISPTLFIVADFVRRAPNSFEEQPKVHKYAGFPSMGAYDPPAPTNWASVPEPARSRIIGHLKKRFGVEFYDKLKLVGGQIVDFNALREREPNSKDYKWEVHAYRLHLRLSLPENGIEFYDASIECRSDGSVMEEIDLPETAKYPDRAKFISASKVFKIAQDKGFDATKTDVELGYNTDLGVCVFTFSQMTRQEYPMLYFKRVDIDAHTGKVLKTYDAEGIH